VTKEDGSNLLTAQSVKSVITINVLIQNAVETVTVKETVKYVLNSNV